MNKNKKIILAALNASFIHSNPAVYALRRSAYTFLRSFRRNITGRQDTPVCETPEEEVFPEIEIAEYTINDRYEDILFDLLSRDADVIGFSVYIWNAQPCLQLLADLRSLFPFPDHTGSGDSCGTGRPSGTGENQDTRRYLTLFAGGPEAETHPEQYLAFCDFVMCGPGEYPFSLFCRKLTEGDAAPWEDLPGAVFQVKETLQRVPEAAEAYHTFAEELPFLYDGTEDFEHRIVYYEASRGCPFRCTYCLSSEAAGVLFREMETVKKELRFFLDQKAALVKFVDRTFNANAKRAREIWSFIKENDNGVTGFHFEIGADLLGREDLDLLKSLRPGLVQLEIGIQSTNRPTLEAIRRTADNEKIFRAVSELRENQNIALHTDLIVGLPYETAEIFRQSFNDVYRLRAHQFQVGFLKVLSGTEMARRAEEYGIISSSRPPYTVLSTKWITPAEIDGIRRIADMVEIFWNAGLFRHALPYLEKLFASPFAMFDALAVYYREQKGNGALSPRLRGAFLAEFAETVLRKREGQILSGPGEDLSAEAETFDAGLFRELLRFDERLHFHPSRRMAARDSFETQAGEHVTIEFDYTKKHPVTKEAEYRYPDREEGADHE